MGKSGRRRRNTAGALGIDDLTDDLVEMILLRIPCRAGLVRYAATCKRWRRLIAGTGFLRRFRSLHRPQVVGQYYCTGNRAAFRGIDGVVLGSGPSCLLTNMFHLSKLPFSTLTDSRGGLVAGFRRLDNSSSIVVFNPLVWEHKQLHAPACGRDAKTYAADCLGAFLIDEDTAGGGSMSHFKVLCVHLLQPCNDDSAMKKLTITTTVEAQVYSARDDSWLPLSTTAVDITEPLVFLGRAGGSLFWFAKRDVFHLNEVTGTFSSLTLPRPEYNSSLRIVSYSRSNIRVVGGGTARLVRIVGDVLDVLRHNNVACRVLLERRVHLSQLLPAAGCSLLDMSWCFVDCVDDEASADRIVLSSSSSRDRMFVVDVDNMTKQLLVPMQTKGKSRCRLLTVECLTLSYELPCPPIIL